MTQEEKAKAYDEALEKAKEYYKDCKQRGNLWFVEDMEDMFPALKESEGERIRKALIQLVNQCSEELLHPENARQMLAWLEKQGEIVSYYEDRLDECACKYFNKGYKHALEKQGEKLAGWSEEDKMQLDAAIHLVSSTGHIEIANWLKSLRPQSTWKPSDEMLEALYRVIPENTMEISEDEMLLDKLYQGLKYGRVLSNK